MCYSGFFHLLGPLTCWVFFPHGFKFSFQVWIFPKIHHWDGLKGRVHIARLWNLLIELQRETSGISFLTLWFKDKCTRETIFRPYSLKIVSCNGGIRSKTITLVEQEILIRISWNKYTHTQTHISIDNEVMKQFSVSREELINLKWIFIVHLVGEMHEVSISLKSQRR